MKRLFLSIVAGSLLATGFASAPAAKQSRTDQGEARKEMRAGNILRSREIEARILPTMTGSEYLGFAYDSTAMAYRLKFIRDSKVIFVDVDAKTGRVLRRSK